MLVGFQAIDMTAIFDFERIVLVLAGLMSFGIAFHETRDVYVFPCPANTQYRPSKSPRM